MGIDEAAFNFLETIEKDLNKIPKEHLIQIVYNTIDSVQEKNNIKEEIQCSRQECSFCCYDDILITPLEAEHIKKAGVVPNISLQTIQQNSHNFRKLNFKDKACIFLKEGKCSIYSHRPMVCRLHNLTKGQSIQQCIVDETGHTSTLNNQVFILELQSLMFYVIKQDLESLKSIYKYNF